MNTFIRSTKAQDGIARAIPVFTSIHTLFSGWGAVAVFSAALVFAGSSLINASHHHVSVSAMLAPVLLFAIGLAPMIGAALVVWDIPGVSRAGRSAGSQLIGASLSAVLFFPALLLVRAFT